MLPIDGTMVYEWYAQDLINKIVEYDKCEDDMNALVYECSSL